LPIAVVSFVARPENKTIRDTLWPSVSKRRTIVIAFAAPFLLVAIFALVLRSRLTSIWMMPAMSLFPVVLLSSPLLKVTHQSAVRLCAFAVCWPLFMVAISPAVAAVIHRIGVKEYADQYRLVAQAVEQAWQEHTDRPLRTVGSLYNLANGISFYLPDQLSVLNILSSRLTALGDQSQIERQGIAIVCPEEIAMCVLTENIYAARYTNASTKNVVISRSYLGLAGPPVAYEILIIPPRAAGEQPLE
jgi:hypothetical protein